MSTSQKKEAKKMGVATAVLGCICMACSAGGTGDASTESPLNDGNAQASLVAQLRGVDVEIAELAAGAFDPHGIGGPQQTDKFHDSFFNDGGWYDTFADSGG